MNPNQRKSTETQQQYRKRLREQNNAAKGRMGRVLWNSARRGTYVKERDGALS